MSTIQHTQHKNYNGRVEHLLHERLQLDTQAKITVDFITRWGMVAAMPDGEDSAGRQALRLATPQELVDRAIETAQLLMEALHDNDHSVMLPELQSQDIEAKD